MTPYLSERHLQPRSGCSLPGTAPRVLWGLRISSMVSPYSAHLWPGTCTDHSVSALLILPATFNGCCASEFANHRRRLYLCLVRPCDFPRVLPRRRVGGTCFVPSAPTLNIVVIKPTYRPDDGAYNAWKLSRHADFCCICLPSGNEF